MRKNFSKTEEEINCVLAYQSKKVSDICFPLKSDIDESINESEKLLHSLGYDTMAAEAISISSGTENTQINLLTWEEIVKEAQDNVGGGHNLEELFTKEELESNKQIIRKLNEEYSLQYKTIYKLDKFDIGIAALGGLLGALVEILLVGIPAKTADGLKAGPLSNYIRDYFDKRFPEDEMQKLANSKVAKVPFDAQDNRNTTINVEGLSAYYHRLLQLGHDPFLGFIFGVADILNGTMTTIDKKGNIVCQVMENYSDRKEEDIFSAICKQLLHLKSDVTTSMGLPAPLMSLFDFLQVGSIGEEKLNIAEIVQGMYYEGYDFIHYCSMSVPVMITEAVIRLGYAIKRIKEGNSIKNSIPFSTNREKHPKLATILFVGHSASTAINAGTVAFTKNPMAINYHQWIAFAKYSYSQLKWVLINKPSMRDVYITGKINEELEEVFFETDKNFDEFISERGMILIN